MNYYQRYYCMRFFYVLVVSLTKTTFVPYLLWRGLARHEVHMVYAIFTIAVMVLEMPTSALGERIGPRKSFLIGCCFKFLAAITFFLGSTLQHFYIAEIISASAVALISGSLNAWLMARRRLDGDFQKDIAIIFMTGSRISKIALALGGVAGAYVADIHLGYPWILVGVGFLSLFVLAIFLLVGRDQIAGKAKQQSLHDKWQNLLCGYRIAIRNQIVLVLIFNAFVVSFALASPKIYWLPYLKEYFGENMRFLGHVWLALAIIQFLGTFGVPTLIRMAGSALRLKLLFSTFSVITLATVVLFRNNIGYFVLFYLLLEWAKPYHRILYLTLLDAQIEGHGRLTILSLEGLISRLGTVLGLMIIGWINEFYPIVIGWSLGVVLYAFVLPCYWYLAWSE